LAAVQENRGYTVPYATAKVLLTLFGAVIVALCAHG
jgi:hypothetical protein